MTISTETAVVRTAGNGVTTAFPFPYHFFSNGDLLVYLVVTATGVATLQTITTHYTVTGADDPDGGTVTFLSAPANTRTVVIIRKPSLAQTVNFSSFVAETANDALDRIYEAMQYDRFRIGQAIRLPDTAAAATLEIPLDRAGKALAFDDDGNIEMVDTAADVLAVNLAAIADAEAAAVAAAVSATNAASSEVAAASSASDASSDAAAADASRLAAAASASAASTSASNASTSAANASSSASSASTSATTATTQASTATTKASEAAASATAALNSRNNAEVFAGNASDSADAAAASAAAAAVSADAFDDVYLGSKAADPTLDNDGNPLVEGQLYWNSTFNTLRVYDGASWVSYEASDGITDVVQDVSPQLGGDLDLNSNDITGSGNINITGTGAFSGAVTVADAAYDATGWNGSAQVPTKNAVRDQIEAEPSATRTLTNKTIALGSNTVSGTTEEFNAALSDGDFATLAGSETLTNKTLTSPTLTTPALGTPASGTLTNCAGLPLAGVVDSTSEALGVGTLELGHASDTTLSRVSAGVVAIEGVNIVTETAAQTLTNKTLTSPTLNTPALGIPASGTLTNCTGLPLSGVVDSTSEALGVGTLEVGHATDTTLARSAAGILTVEGTPLLKAGKQTISIPAGAMQARTTNGAASGTGETTTNKIMRKTLDFDASTQEFAQFIIPMPKSWDEGTVTFQVVWSHASTVTNFGVAWALEAVALSDDDAQDAAFGTAVQVTDTGGTTDDLYITSESSAVTIAGSPAEGDTIVFQIKRVPADAADTLAVDARLHAIRLFITTNAATDA